MTSASASQGRYHGPGWRCIDLPMADASAMKQPPLWSCIAMGSGSFIVAAVAELAMGRRLWGINAQPGVWSGDVNSAHNSQLLADPYTFSHITHGLLLYGLTWLVAPRLPMRVRAVMAIAAEAAWEIVENTDFVIQRYRAATISLHYYGDSVMNSMCDILACAAGILLASMLPARMMVVGVIVLEVTLALWIRDSFFLNVLMLLYP